MMTVELVGDVKDSASSKALPAVTNYADIPLSSTTLTPQQDVASETSAGETTKATAQVLQHSQSADSSPTRPEAGPWIQ